MSKGRSMSDQPASCPLCGAILRQSRNLRRHLELLHFGIGSTSKASLHMRHRRPERSGDFARSPFSSMRASHVSRSDASYHTRPSENSEFPTITPLSIASAVGASASNVALAGNLMGPTASILGTTEQTTNPLCAPSVNSCATMAPTNNGLYSSDGSASLLSCLLPSLPSLPSLSSPHDVFRHGEMLRAGIAYHDSSRQHARHLQRTDVT